MDILSLEAFKSYLGDELGADSTADFTTALNATERDIHNYCGRRIFVGAAPATARLFVPNGTSVARIYDCTSVTVVSDNGTTVSASDYQLEPVNGLSWAGESVPYDQIRRLSGCWTRDGAKAVLSVTAVWGWAAIPAPVVEACKIVGKDIVLHRGVSFGIAAMTAEGGVRARQAAIVAQLLAPYRRVESFGLA